MKISPFMLFLVGILSLPLTVLAQGSPQNKKMRTVQKVIYGDTLVLDGGEVVRLIGVESPKFSPKDLDANGQPKHPHSAVAGWVRRGREFTEGMVSGRQVWLEYGEKKTINGQTWAYVYFNLGQTKALGGGGMKPLLTGGTYQLNRLILQYGMATAGNPFPYSLNSQFRQLETQAREQQVGLFQSNF